MNIRRHKLHLVLALVLGTALFEIAPAPAMSSGSTDARAAAQLRPDARKKLEELHRRVVAHAQADDDENTATLAVRHNTIPPERAAELAIRSHGGGRLKSIELQNRNGKVAYHVRLDQSDHYVDAVTGGVTRGDGQ